MGSQMLTENKILGTLYYYYWVISNSYLDHHKDWWSHSRSQTPTNTILINRKYSVSARLAENAGFRKPNLSPIVEHCKDTFICTYESVLKSSCGLVCQCGLMTETVYFLPRTIESLYKELVEKGLLIQALKVNLSDYIGKVHWGQCLHLSHDTLRGSRNAFHLCLFPAWSWWLLVNGF